MTPPTVRVRAETYKRDRYQCVACGTTENPSWQHRAAVGMGGAGSKKEAVTVADGVLMCLRCNTEAEGAGQSRALANGWKIRRNRGGMLAADIPYYATNARAWYLPLDLERANPLVPMLALELLDAAGSLSNTVTRETTRLGVAITMPQYAETSEASSHSVTSEVQEQLQ